jgi:ligand-binding sensor domain-containing protein/two-component sensor histidine kinase
MRVHRALALCTAAVFSLAQARLQTNPGYLVQQVNIRGLPANLLQTGLLQDKKGFLWISTLNGLYRYDGFRAQVFLSKPTDSQTLSHNYVESMADDESGNLLLGTFGGGLNRMDFEQSVFRRIPVDSLGPEAYVVVKVLHDKARHRTWIGTSASVTRYGGGGSGNTMFLFPAGFGPQSRIQDFIPLPDGELMVATGLGLYRTRPGQKILDSLPANRNGLIPYTTLARDKQGLYWAGGPRGITWIDAATLLPMAKPEWLRTLGPLAKDSIRKIMTGRNGTVWIANNHGVFVADLSAGRCSRVDAPIPQVNDLLEDHQGSVWACTEKAGLYRITAPAIRFMALPGLSRYSLNEPIYQIAEARDKSWLISTPTRLLRYQPKDHHLEPLPIPTRVAKPVFAGVLADSRGRTWTSTELEGCFMTDMDGRVRSVPLAFVRAVADKRSIDARGLFFDFMESPNGDIWGGLYTTNPDVGSAIFRYNEPSGRFQQLMVRKRDSSDYLPVAVSTLLDGGSNLWVSSWNGGIFLLKKENGYLQILKNLHAKSPPRQRLSSTVASCMRLDSAGIAWVGTVGGGLNRYDPVKDSVTIFTIAEGLPSNLIYRMEWDKDGFLWISTDNGLSRFDPKTFRCTNYSHSTGLQSVNFYFQSSMRAADGTLCFGTSDGMVIRFNPSEALSEPNTLRTVITEIRLANKPVQPGPGSLLRKSSYLTDTLTLEYHQNVIGFELSNMDLAEPGTFTYAYKLEGFDEQWTQLTDRNSITYTNLDPGTYTLLVKNANHLGVWNDNADRLTLIVRPPFWRTGWFLAAMAALVIGAIYLLFRYRLRQQLRILAVRQRLHRDLHDDVGATLSSVKAYSELLHLQPQNSDLPTLIRDNAEEMLEKLDAIAWATNPAHDRFGSLAEKINTYAYQRCHSQGIRLDSNLTDLSPELAVPGDVRQHLLLILKEAVNNLCKYSRATTASIHARIDSNRLWITVSDDGVGIGDKVQGSGNGMANMHHRAAECGGTLRVESTAGGGTTLHLEIPYPFHSAMKQPQPISR